VVGAGLAAGNLTVVLSNDHLRIRGDAEANLISLVSESPGEITVGHDGTINGGVDPFVAQGVVDVSIIAAGGDDTLNTADLFPGTLPGDLRISTGDGADIVDLCDTSVGGDLTIRTGSGDDQVGITPGFYGGGWAIRTGSGADTIAVESVQVDGPVSIRTSGGADAITTNFDAAFHDDVEMATGTGDDPVALEFTTFDGDVTRIVTSQTGGPAARLARRV
jgi:hypothetical protein